MISLAATNNNVILWTVVNSQASCTDCAEYIESVIGGADDDTGQLWMPVQFFNLLLSLVYKQQLCRHIIGRVWHHIVWLDGKVPDCQSVIGRRHRQHRAVVWIPFQWCDRCSVVPEWHDRSELGTTRLNIAQMTHLIHVYIIHIHFLYLLLVHVSFLINEYHVLLFSDKNFISENRGRGSLIFSTADLLPLCHNPRLWQMDRQLSHAAR